MEIIIIIIKFYISKFIYICLNILRNNLLDYLILVVLIILINIRNYL